MPSGGRLPMPTMPFSDWKRMPSLGSMKRATPVGRPMPRLTSEPGFNSRATRRWMISSGFIQASLRTR